MMSPEKIAEEFVSDCEKVINKKLVYIFFGSVRFKKYVEKKSDIDIVLLADKGFILPKEWLKIIDLMKEYGKKYWKVKKEKRMVSLIDVMIIPYPEAQLNFRKQLKKVKIKLKYTKNKTFPMRQKSVSW